MSHQAARRSTLAGGAASGAATAPAAMAFSGVQSFSVLRDGTRLQMRCVSGRPDCDLTAGFFALAIIFLLVDVRESRKFEQLQKRILEDFLAPQPARNSRFITQL